MSAAPYAVPRHPAPTDLDLAGTELAWRGELPSVPAALDRYPDRRPLTEALAARFGVSPARVLVTAGSDDALERSFRLLLGSGTEAVLATPTFEMLGRFARWTGAEVRTFPWPGGPFPVEACLAAVTPRTRVIAIVSPNNPT
ncbi:MAG TPA: aminotransferase class I/II-fold pyridoxal phosphate-dependent enzyme, partial [Gemmatimonadales bacterium]|nr:aminotransferase class I/II-fold pyridoxal phosphate-dependent enzyme [Gemmatimonadales bacterium]